MEVGEQRTVEYLVSQFKSFDDMRQHIAVRFDRLTKAFDTIISVGHELTDQVVMLNYNLVQDDDRASRFVFSAKEPSCVCAIALMVYCAT